MSDEFEPSPEMRAEVELSQANTNVMLDGIMALFATEHASGRDSTDVWVAVTARVAKASKRLDREMAVTQLAGVIAAACARLADKGHVRPRGEAR